METKEILKDRKEMEGAIYEAVKKFMEKHQQLKVNCIHVHSEHAKQVKTGVAILNYFKIKSDITLL